MTISSMFSLSIYDGGSMLNFMFIEFPMMISFYDISYFTQSDFIHCHHFNGKGVFSATWLLWHDFSLYLNSHSSSLIRMGKVQYFLEIIIWILILDFSFSCCLYYLLVLESLSEVCLLTFQASPIMISGHRVAVEPKKSTRGKLVS